MSARIRLVVSDVDGTIVSKDKSLLPATIAAAQRLQAAGIALVLVSSRPPRAMQPIYDRLKLTGPIAAFNGGIINNGAERIAENLVSADATMKTLEFLAQQEIDAWLFADDQWILKNPHNEYVPLERHTVGFDPVVVDDFTPYLGRCGKIVGVSKNFDLLQQCQPKLNDRLKGEAAAQLSQQYYLDINHPAANKGAALRAIASWYSFDLTEVATIGDMTNDVSMFRLSGFSIAMGNAPPAVAAEADVQTGPNTETGWADAIDCYILNGATR